MALMPRHRQELFAIVALLVGVFIGLALLPIDLTGPAGRSAGRFLWKGFGAGAALLPFLGLTMALAGFGRLPALDLRRAAILFSGLLFLVPFAIALVFRITTAADLPADYDQWTTQERLIGVVPALLAVGATAAVGMAGAVIIGLVGLSALTLVTLDWHPFRRLSVEQKSQQQVLDEQKVEAPFAGEESWRATVAPADAEDEED